MNVNLGKLVKAALCACALLCASARALAQHGPARSVSADYQRVKGPRDRLPQLVVGAGRAAEGLRADWQRYLGVVRRECGFEYLCFHGLLQDKLGVYGGDGRGRPVYNFQYVDAVYDAMLAAGGRPFVEFGFMPQRMASGEKTIFWWKGNITPPRTLESDHIYFKRASRRRSWAACASHSGVGPRGVTG